MNIPIVHLYPQPVEHFPGQILGTREGLIALRDAINKALDAGAADEDVYQSDGEGYTLQVRCVTSPWAQALPNYYEEYANNTWSDTERAAFDAAMDGRAA